ncbi:unnamed protein product [Rotaria sordida]|uniref:BHLH domain-containing protein n=1 Tax=Rotaria sordida TaxID=392033 RepID=A0A813UXF9_9BILA|nr:unnamed protein product [Rotaria sordida]CAF0856293.1 unnamed protein product [Rotaria sordida]
MALQKRSENKKRISDDCLSDTISSSTLEIVLDDQSFSNSGDEEYIDQIRQSTVGTTGNESSTCRRKKSIPLRDPKSHRLIEKRRRDRMNACLNELLQLTPHKNHESQRRIEKTEIIELAIAHMRHLILTLEQNSKNTDTNLDAYRTGYQNGLSDIFEFISEYAESDQLIEFAQYCKEKEIDLKSLTVLPDRKRPKYLSLSDKRIKSPILSKEQFNKSNLSNKNDEKLCIISNVEEYKHSDLQSSIGQQQQQQQQQTSTEQYDSPVKVPIFVLHPSGTHYIPMCIDASIVSHAFTKNSNRAHSSTTDQALCHPVSIPVNFNPITAASDAYELDIQNINVIGTRHQTSVRPN